MNARKKENVTSFPCYKNECFLAEKCLRWKDRGVVFAVAGCLCIYWLRLSTAKNWDTILEM
jgi:hypothetical protein